MSHERIEILLVEDNPADVELTLRTLKKNNLANAVRVARDGEEALDILFCREAYASTESTTPKLILLDLKLPKVDGFEVLEAIRRHPRTALIPVVILTSSKEHEDIVRSYRLQVNSYIQKPVHFGQFQEAIGLLGLYWLVTNVPCPQEVSA